MRLIDISEILFIGRTSALKQTWVQKLVCKLFKITPEIKYYFTVKVSLASMSSLICLGDVVATETRYNWLVTHVQYSNLGKIEIENQIIVLENLEPQLIHGLYGQMAIKYNTYSE